MLTKDRSITLWLPADLRGRLDLLLASQQPSSMGARATRHAFLIAAVRRSIEEQEDELAKAGLLSAAHREPNA